MRSNTVTPLEQTRSISASPTRRTLAIVAPFLWLLGSAVWFAAASFPSSAVVQILWIAVGLASLCVNDLAAGLRSIALEWSPLLGTLFLYDEIHAYVGRFQPAPHALLQAHFDRWLGHGHLPTVALQHLAYNSGAPHIWDYLALIVYTGHFWLPLAIGMLLWKRFPELFGRFVAMFATLTTAGYITYVLYPALPPWLAAQHHVIPPVHRVVEELFANAGFTGIAATFAPGSSLAIAAGAVPSLHAAYPLLMALFLWPIAARWARIALVIYPPAMAITLIYGGEHYVFDILLGWLYALATWFIVNALTARVHRRRDLARNKAAALTR